MVVTREMQETVDNEKKKFFSESEIAGFGVAEGCVGRDHDIAEQAAIQVAKLTFLKRKRNNIRRLIPGEILLVDALNGWIVYKSNADFLIRAIHQPHETGHLGANFPLVNSNSFLQIFDSYFHRILF